MEAINKGFSEIRSESTTGGSINSLKNPVTVIKENPAEEQNQNITSIFGSENLIERYLESIVAQNNNLLLLRSYKTLLRKDNEFLVDSVKILSGGAANAEPIYSGSIGQGMLTGAVFGELTKCPPALTILQVLRIMSRNNTQGIMVIVSNNLANRLNFGSACQSAAQEGIKTLLINVGEDVSGVSVSKTIGRKGLCGIKFLFKIAGAMAEEKKTLYEIFQVIEKLKGNSLGSISVQIRPDKMVIGPGCKGEPEKVIFLWNTFDDIGGNARLSFIVKQALSHLFHPSSYFSLHVVKGDEVVMIVNNLGKLFGFYLSIIIKEILDQMKTLGITVSRIYSGRFLNANLVGFSISVLKVKDNILELLDRPANATSWNEKSSLITEKPNIIMDLPTTPISLGDNKCVGPKFTKQEAIYLVDVLPNVIETIRNMEEYLNKLDNDHDFGTAMTKFANAIEMEIKNRSLKISSPYEFLNQMAYLSGFTMGGAAGGIFSILFSSAAQVFLVAPPDGSADIQMWVEAARAARDGLKRFTRVKPGDKTILDALDPFVESPTENNVKGLSKRVTAAVKGAEGTTRSSRGSIRAEGTVVGDATEVPARAPDPGALCLASVIRTIFIRLQIELAEAEAQGELSEVVRKKRPSKVRDEEQKTVTLSTVQSYKGEEPKTDTITTLPGEESKSGTTLKGEESKSGTTLKGHEPKTVTITTLPGEEQKSGTTLKDEESKSGTTLKEDERKTVTITTLTGEEQKSGSTLKGEESMSGSILKGEKSKSGSTLRGEERKTVTITTFQTEEPKSGTVTTLKGEEPKTVTVSTLKAEEPKTITVSTSKGDEQKSGTILKEGEPKSGTTLKSDEQKRGTTLKEEEPAHGTTLKEEDLKRGTTLKEEEPTHGTTLEDSQPLKEKHSEQFGELKEVIDEIAQEIEDEVPDENN